MFNALIARQSDTGQAVSLEALELTDLPDNDVLIRVDYSTVNYKDGLALTGTRPIIRSYPLVPGIDLAGVIESSRDDRWQVGDRVVVNGWGLGEGHWGGLAQYAQVKSDWLVKLPETITTREAMSIGTAGYTAALCVNALLKHGTTPADGEILVTGATGGVGSVAVALLAAQGFKVVASTGKINEDAYLKALGASECVDRESLNVAGNPLQRERWAGVVDALGGQTLANACAQTCYGGAVAACGLAESAALPATVMPFILRGVTLYGIDSVMAPTTAREQAWQRLATDLDKTRLESMINEISLAEAMNIGGDVLAGKIRGRLLVDVNR
ncbi:MAG: oxidoreductase [Halieaceae bacterium]|jgi:acrylyl-CoA reductase (NADPH)|nr:oxidoreductase [Halieaceae bacterium]MDG1493155.1 oxidoreductase [Luminiphilus sp.]MDG2137441.1 oxidoreductase [Luminiphilus sp.]MDG2493774.1 oxidoreductase [Luminiphilus sp.]